ncbi:hypothetical protein Tco_0265620 [Tanacetum coccineum]
MEQSSYKKEYTRAGNELATGTFPFLADVIADPHASDEALLSKKPRVTPLHALMSPPSQITPAVTSVSKTQFPPPAQ